MNSDGRKVHQVLLFALTVAAVNIDQVQGAVSKCMKQLRDTQLGLRYFWWAEFQARGAVHYHGVLVDPSFEFERDARQWFDQHWPHAEIQTWVKTKSAAWFRDNDGDYVLKDVNKGARKGYEQQYEAMPRGWRTFSSHHLVFTSEEHQEHESKVYVTWQAEKLADGSHQLVAAVSAIDRHCPARGGCRVRRDDRVRLRRRARAGATSARSGIRSVPKSRGSPRRQPTSASN